MAFVTKIVPPSFLEVRRNREPSNTIRRCCPGIAGRARSTGRSSRARPGPCFTIFRPDDGLDAGPVLLQKTVEIGPDDTLGTVYFEKLFRLGVSAMVEAVDLVKAGKAPRIQQDHSQAALQIMVHAGRCRHRLEPAGGRGLQPHPRRRSSSRCMDAARRNVDTDFDAAKAGPVKDRRAPWPQSARMKSRLRLPAGRPRQAGRIGNGEKALAVDFARARGIAPGTPFRCGAGDPAPAPVLPLVNWR